MSARARIGLGVTLGALGLIVTCLYLGAAATPIRAQQDELVERGRFLYRVYCMNCHGETGEGDGVSAGVLKIKPTDMTRLSLDNPDQPGEFPFDRVYRVIDGREAVGGHGSRRMPIWGLNFQELDRDVDQEDEVRGKILQLIEYLKSIQKPAD
jgi:hypothetical protein